MKKHWVNPDCQNSEPTKRTVSISAYMRFKKKVISRNTKSVGTQLFLLGSNQDNNHGSNFITKKKI